MMRNSGGQFISYTFYVIITCSLLPAIQLHRILLTRHLRKKITTHYRRVKVSWRWGFPEQPISFVAMITIPCPDLCSPAVNSCGSRSWQAIRRSRRARCWAALTSSQQLQLHMFEIMLWLFFLLDFYCLLGLQTCHSCRETVFLSIILLQYLTVLVSDI